MTETQDTVRHQDMANAIRFLSADAVQKAKSGHPGMPMGMADVATVLFTEFLKFDAKSPRWADRDRFILSAGHGSMLLYSLLHLTGYEDVPMEEIKNFRQLGSKTAGHPEYGHIMGAETTTGPLGQGVATSVGMALAEQMLQARFGSALVDHYTYVIAGDGCLMEGISQEAISLAGHLKLHKLIVLWDDNNISIDGSLDVSSSEDQRARFEAAGWNVMAVDGHDAEAVSAAIAAAKDSDRPTMIACRTVIGFGAPTLAGSEKTHGAPLGDAELAGAREHLEWPYAPFEIPAHVLEAWRAAGVRGQADKAAWEERLNASALKAEFESALSGDVPVAVKDAFAAFIDEALATQPKLATRKASQNVLEAIVPSFPGIVGGSADLTHSNLTITKDMVSVKPGDFAGNYIHYGIREHGMAAAMNGIALHGGFVPYGGTFMVFTDYLRPALRLSALMAQRVIYVMTHDSIGLGEDGPTHQPVEHLASLRAMPNVLTFRPADVVETAEAWQTALETTHAPSVLCLSRQGLPCLRKDAPENMVARGGYILRDVDGARDVTLMASGSEVELAVNAAAQLAAKGIKAVVVSMPCQELFDKQPVDYKKAVLGDESLPRVAIEAAATYGWERYTGFNGAIIGMTSFGASAPAGDLFAHFGITSEAVVAAAVARVQG